MTRNLQKACPKRAFSTIIRHSWVMRIHALVGISLLISASFIEISFAKPAGQKPDRYEDYLDLARHEKEGKDFVVEVRNRHSPGVVIAIHGGHIEAGTDVFAKSIAEPKLSYYVFKGVKPKNNRELHVTSTHFNDPRVLELVENAETVISVHGFKDESKDEICIGGKNTQLRNAIAKDLRSAKLGLEITVPCPSYGGDDLNNLVNRSKKHQGVQLELSSHFRDRIEKDKQLGEKIASVIRMAIDVHER